jgi:hypothetical protein
VTALPTAEACPLPGCENPRGGGKTGGCCLAHATALAWAARPGRPAVAAPKPGAVRPKTKQQLAAEDQQRRERQARLAERLRAIDRQAAAAYREQVTDAARRPRAAASGRRPSA